MDQKIAKILAAISMIVVAIFTIATSSIAIECYNKNESFSQEKTTNKNFVIVTLVIAILAILSGSVLLVTSSKN